MEEVAGVRFLANADEVDSWTTRDIEDMGIIFYNIDPAYQTSVEGSNSAAEMWNQLLLEYANVAAANSSQLTSKFYQYRMDPNHSVTAHANRLKMMAEELKSVNAPVTDAIFIMRILQTLPPSFDVFQIIWNTVPSIQQTVANLIARLVTEEQRLKIRNEGIEAPADTAFFASHPSRVIQQQTETAYASNGNHANRREGSNESQNRDSNSGRSSKRIARTLAMTTRTKDARMVKIQTTRSADCLCEECIFGKMKETPFKTGRTRATKVGEIIHCDSGFSPIETFSGETSYILLKDDYSEWTQTTLMKRKSEVEKHLVNFIDFIENISGNSAKIVRTDGGTEFGNNRLKNYFNTKGIVH